MENNKWNNKTWFYAMRHVWWNFWSGTQMEHSQAHIRVSVNLSSSVTPWIFSFSQT